MSSTLTPPMKRRHPCNEKPAPTTFRPLGRVCTRCATLLRSVACPPGGIPARRHDTTGPLIRLYRAGPARLIAASSRVDSALRAGSHQPPALLGTQAYLALSQEKESNVALSYHGRARLASCYHCSCCHCSVSRNTQIADSVFGPHQETPRRSDRRGFSTQTSSLTSSPDWKSGDSRRLAPSGSCFIARAVP